MNTVGFRAAVLMISIGSGVTAGLTQQHGSTIHPRIALESAGQRSMETVNVDFCTLVHSPETYSGKRVRVRGRVERFIHGEVLSSDECKGKVYIATPSMVTPRPAFSLIQDAEFEAYDNACIGSAPGVPSDCRLLATFEGRFDTRFRFVKGKRTRVARGFGPDELMSMQIVIAKVSQVVVDEDSGPAPDVSRSP